MVRLLIVLFWLSLIVGTCVAGNVVGNWVVCLLALAFFIRSRRRRTATGSQPEGAAPTRGGADGAFTGRPDPIAPAQRPAHATHPLRPPAHGRRWR